MPSHNEINYHHLSSAYLPNVAPDLLSTAGSAAEHSYRLAILRTCRQLNEDTKLLHCKLSLFKGSPGNLRRLLTFIPLAHRNVVEVVQIVTSSDIASDWRDPLRELFLELVQFKSIKKVNLVFREWGRPVNPGEMSKTIGNLKIQLEKLRMEMERTPPVPIIDAGRLHIGRIIWTGIAWTHEIHTSSSIMSSLS
ncbi:hypothetical protein HBH99_039530 [Parastagonospora nodorum]|nr:hypothetical protein HBH94_033160 [Parastagonospora nodorum]KAH4424846.1 hypothetical protein HBH99_039530 [Parastagonospora nodorum]KAH5802003.1 hypothetical protein HBI94_205700 [Parastagonospora nodorum]KAH5811979.1 hypothetical protein HBI93_221640 [Parastagonospora nodorum]KAH6433712.1 hypothetical protein HBI14_020460 [Parastagonospora nodorum]